MAREEGFDSSGCTILFDRFMRKEGLSLCRCTHISQMMPRYYEEKSKALQRFIINTGEEEFI